MRPSIFLSIFALFISANGLPLPRHVPSAADATDVPSSTESSLPIVTASSSVAIDSPLQTDISVAISSAIESSVIASATDSSLPDATDTATDPSVTDPSTLPSGTDQPETNPSALPTATDVLETDASALPIPTDASASDSIDTELPTSTENVAPTPSSTGISFDIPEVPSACLALPSIGIPIPSTSVLTSSIPSITDSSTLPTDSLSLPSESSSVSVDSSTAVNATATETAVDSSAVANATVTSTVSESTAPALPTDGAANVTLTRRIAQEDLPDVAQSWQDLCLVSGGDIITNDPCVQLAGIDGINALLADADPCAQQDNADAMIDFAKSPGVTNADALIANAIAYRQHARNAYNINGVVPATPYLLHPSATQLGIGGACERAARGCQPGNLWEYKSGAFCIWS
ncbi:hypothetical protein C8Q76DRAFT_815666 [Earliella scabrosa]|nr:hypothetical protein C8Q76DRAFT_815666 [Earliella scabrosa]